MHRRKGKKILIYFFLLILVGSINNVNFSNHEFYSVKKINVTGFDSVESSIFLNKIQSSNFKNIFFLDKIKINKLLIDNALVENYTVFKKYPSTLNFEIKKTDVLARIKKNGKTFLIGSNGKLITNDFSDQKLPYIFGNADIKNFLNLKNILDKSKFSYENIKNLYFFPSNRWDIELQNNIVIKLPKFNLIDALNNAFDFLNEENFQNTKLVDLRIENQIIINDRRN